MTKIKKNYLGKQYEITVSVDEFNAIWISVSEVVRPTWKIFRTRYIDSTVFFIDDYETILEGEVAMLDAILQKEKEEKERRQKWAEFNK